nr:hypothetical protein I302_01084 [Kwoniella bestiolae CBS 10118]OCF29576.1 hypothetical protein I302_01084 [Kwoniella bestiolae CBS 10118]
MSFGTSPTAPSLLIPSNPAFSPVETAPKGGILINVHRASEPTLSIDPTLAAYQSQGHIRRPSDPSSITSEKEDISSSYSPVPSPILGGNQTPGLKSLKIRFAPLPDPRRPRSLSTGRNIAWTNEVDENGDEKRQLSLKDHAVDDYAVQDESDEEPPEEEDGDEESKTRRWSKSMGLSSSWKVSKKLLTGKNPIKDKEKDKEEMSTYGQGAPLKKSVSTGGFIGSSPFRWTAETERKSSMQGTSPPTVTSFLSSRSSSTPGGSSPSASGHRRNSSLEPGSSYNSRLSSSPSTTPIRMMNGRVYGSRRASEAAAREKQLREKNEPAFVEWGQGQVAQRTTEETGTKGGFLGDNDDGGGMAWVKRRREERERERLKKEQEEQERKEREQVQGGEEKSGMGGGLSSSQSSSTSSLDLNNQKPSLGINTSNLKTPAIEISELPPTPIIRVSESDTSNSNDSPRAQTRSEFGTIDEGPKGERMAPTPPNVSSPKTGHSAEMIEERKEGDHVVQAMRIPSGGNNKNKNKLTDPFGQESSRRGVQSEDEDEDDDEEEEEGEDDGDFEDDEEEEMDIR